MSANTRHYKSALWRLLAVATLLLSGALAALATSRPAAVQYSGGPMAKNDRAIFQGYVYEARNENCAVVVYWFALDGSRSGRTPLGGCVKYHVAIAASHNDDFLVVAGRGQDDSLWTRTTFNGDTYADWTNGGDGGRFFDDPVAHTVSSAGYVGVMVTVSGGPNTNRATRGSPATGPPGRPGSTTEGARSRPARTC